MKRNFTLFLFLIVITDPYSGRGIDYAQEEPQLYEYKKTAYKLKVYGPEPESNVSGVEETSFTEEETQRFINKVNNIINYSPYVYK